MNFIVIFLVSLTCIMSVIWAKKIDGNWLSPTSCFVLGNTFTYLLYLLNTDLFVKVNYSTFIILITSFILFFFGSISAELSRMYKISILKDKSMNINGIQMMIYLSFFVGIFSTLYLWKGTLSTYGLTYILSDFDEVMRRGFDNAQFIGNFALWLIFVLPLCLEKYYVENKINKQNLVLCIIAIIGLIFLRKKTYIILSLVMVIWIAIKHSKNLIKTLKILILLLCSSILVFFISFKLILSDNSSEIIYKNIIMYFSGSWAALGELIIHQPFNPTHFGQHVFYPIYKVLSLFYNVDPGKIEMEGMYIPDWFNVYTMHGEAFVDFGYIGIILQTFILGFVSQIFYRKSILKNSVRADLIYGIFFFCIIMSFFVSEITHFITWFLLISIYVLAYFSSKISR